MLTATCVLQFIISPGGLLKTSFTSGNPRDAERDPTKMSLLPASVGCTGARDITLGAEKKQHCHSTVCNIDIQ